MAGASAIYNEPINCSKNKTREHQLLSSQVHLGCGIDYLHHAEAPTLQQNLMILTITMKCSKRQPST